jgi:vacuolar-type H+-ATPase subunit I/STV1
MSEQFDTEALRHFITLIRDKTSNARKTIAELDARIDRTITEWQDLKKNEIELQTLERQFRKNSHTKQGA